MILADKIILLRKKAGWSQEELAEQLNVTRQSVSKWEGAQSIPDINKIIQLSKIFGVTTDYLLRDELEEEEPCQEDKTSNTKLRRVTMEEAAEYLRIRNEAAPRMAFATALCILSPICLIMLAGISELSFVPLSENMAGGMGLCILMIMVAIAVAIFLSCYGKAKPFEFLENEPFETEYGVIGMVKEQKTTFQAEYHHRNVTGTLLCILSVIPLFLSACFQGPDLLYIAAMCLMFVIISVGCYAFVYAGTRQGAMERLLQEGEYSEKKKEGKKLRGTISGAYWLIVTAIFLYYTFGPQGNAQPQYSWFIWAIAGVIYGALMCLWNILEDQRRN